MDFLYLRWAFYLLDHQVLEYEKRYKCFLFFFFFSPQSWKTYFQVYVGCWGGVGGWGVRKALKHQKAQTTVESIILWKASVLQLDHSEGCDSTICHVPFFQGFKFFITAVDICYWLSHLWPVLPLSGLSSPEKHHLSWFIGHVRPETIVRTLHISPGCMCPTLISFQQILGWLKPWLNILALCDSWIKTFIGIISGFPQLSLHSCYISITAHFSILSV